MTDLVVTIPRDRWQAWLDEGDLAGDAPTHGHDWGFYVSHCAAPPIDAGDALYIVAHGRLRGFALVSKPVCASRGGYLITRAANAKAVTIAETINGFQGWRRRWWNLADELPFPDWKTRGVIPPDKLAAMRARAGAPAC